MPALNARRAAKDLEAWWPRRDEAYIGVLIDDLITQGTLEPYRMFTSRAEYRLLLREDNADLRLTEKGYELGLVDNIRWQLLNKKREAIEYEKQRLQDCWVRPQTEIGKATEKLLQQPLLREYRALDLLRRPEINYTTLAVLLNRDLEQIDPKVMEQIEIQAKYTGYLEQQSAEIERQRRNEETRLPAELDYQQVDSLSTEIREKLQRAQPATVGQAARIPGVTPVAISLLLVHLKKRNIRKAV